MSSNESKKWDNLTVIQLKGALSRRGLAASGSKEELKKRLIEYEEKKNEKNKKSSLDFSNEEDEEGSVPMFTGKCKVKNGYDAYQALKTVIIHPFSTDLFRDVNFTTWLNGSKSFTIRKTHHGEMAAELVFPACSHGEVAYSNLQSALPDMSIVHPPVSFMEDDKSTKIRKPDEEVTYLDEILKPKPEGSFWSRLVVLEGLSAEHNNEEKLMEFFPEAYNHISYQYSQETAGLAILEFFTEEECNNYVKTIGMEPIQVGEDDVKVEKFNEKFKEWRNKTSKTKKTKDPKGSSKDNKEKKSMTDKERLLLNAELVKMRNLVESMSNIKVETQEEIEEKLKKFNICLKKLSAKKDKLKMDTEQRLKINKRAKLPESADDYQDVTVNTLVSQNPDISLPKAVETKFFSKVQNEIEICKQEIAVAKADMQHKSQIMTSMINYLPRKLRKEPDVIVIEDDNDHKSDKKPRKTSDSSSRRAEKRPSAPSSRRRSRSRSRDKEQSSHKKEEKVGGELFISKFDKKWSENWLKSQLDKQFPGSISIRVPMKGAKESKGFAFMTFPSESTVDDYVNDPRKRPFHGCLLVLKKNQLTPDAKSNQSGRNSHKTDDSNKRNTSIVKTCHNCDQEGHFARECGNAPKCHKCGKSGHFAKDCGISSDEPPAKMRRDNRSPDRYQERHDRSRERPNDRQDDRNSDDYRKYYERLQQRFEEKDFEMDHRMDRSENIDVDERMQMEKSFENQQRRSESHQMSDPMYGNERNQRMNDSYMNMQQQMFDNDKNQGMSEQQMFERMNNPMHMDERQGRMNDNRDLQGMSDSQRNQRMMNDPYYQDKSSERNQGGNDPKVDMLRDMTGAYSDTRKQMELQYGMMTSKDQMGNVYQPVPKVQNSGNDMSRQLGSRGQMTVGYPVMGESADPYGQISDSARKAMYQQQQQQQQQHQQPQQSPIKQDYQSPYSQAASQRQSSSGMGGGGGAGGTIVEYDIRALKAARDRGAAVGGLQTSSSLPNAIPSPLDFYKQMQQNQQAADAYRNRPY